MQRIKDKVKICWTTPDGKPVEEEIITYETEEEVPEESTSSSSDYAYRDMHLEDVSLDKLLLLLVLDNCVEKVGILRCITQLDHQLIPLKFPEYKTIDERFGQVMEYEQDIASESKKRYSDLVMIHSILYRTMEEIGSEGSYTSLGDAIRIIRKLEEDEKKLIRDEEESRILEEEYKHKLRTQKRVLEAEYKDRLETLRQQEDRLEDAIAYGKLECKYLEAWEAARRHQAFVVQERSENKYRDIIQQHQVQIELENRIHGELIKFFTENAEELNNDITYWVYRYESEIESRDAEILKLRINRDAQLEKFDQMKATYETQKEFIDYWQGVKDERRMAEQRRLLEELAAAKIQQWWRQVMKRRGLGPYKKKAKGKGGKKKKK